MMTDPLSHTSQLHHLWQRFGSGDRAARDELFCAVCARLELLAHKMLQGFPGVKRYVEAGDVVQNALLRLLRALEKVQPTTVQDFFNFAACQLRRELLDLARRVRALKGQVVQRVTHVGEEDSDIGAVEPSDHQVEDPGEIDRWCAFHQHAERLPVEQREVMGLMYYHGWTQAEVAELLHITERTVRRHWRSARAKLRHILKDR
jgi:RNA polymerase sigma factor (sigma-70 family)